MRRPRPLVRSIAPRAGVLLTAAALWLAVLPAAAAAADLDVGEIAVLEHDGSNYDAHLPGGAVNYEARAAVGRRFYETHPDAYDFLAVFTNFEFQTSDATAFHLDARTDVEGIGIPPGSVAEEPFGSPSRLKGWIDMSAVSRYRVQPLSLTPGDPGFIATLNVLGHELGHQWLARVLYRDGEVNSKEILGADDTHWSYLLDSDASLLYGADWKDVGDGTYSALRVKQQYSALDLYLMGFLAPEKVPPFTLLRNPAVDRQAINREGESVTATPTTVTVEQIVAANGSRVPDSLHSQKEFRIGFVFLTAPGTEPTPEDLEAVDRVRRAFGAHFFALTHGVAWADTTLGMSPPGPLAPAPDLARALDWLVARQGLDGAWADTQQTSVRDTAAAVRALGRAGATGTPWQRGLLWLQQAEPESLDFLARSGSALAEARTAGIDPAARLLRILAGQNTDGGFGAGRDFASDALDTALALRALRALGHPPDSRVRAAVGALQRLAAPDGGWLAVAGGQTSTVVTAEVLLALLDWPDVPGSAPLRSSGLAALLARQNPDGGFGSSPSTPFASALALDVLLRSGAPAAVVDPLTAWLERSQRADGSWEGSPFQTALVLGALRNSAGANLVVPADTLVLAPNPAHEGETVRVSAKVRNTGRSAAPASVARLFDGSGAVGPWEAEAGVPALGPGQEADVAFDFPTADRPGAHTLSVVADAAGQVTESREDDNTTPAALTVVGLLADLVVTPGGIGVMPSAPEVGEDTTVSVTVANLGERVSPDSEVLLVASDPAGLARVLPRVPLPALAPGESATVSFVWTPTTAGPHSLRATADPGFAVPESSEVNNAAARTVAVLAAAPAGADLAVRAVSLTPGTLRELPQVVAVEVVADNTGRAPAMSSLAVFDGPFGGQLATVPIDLEARSGKTVTISVTISTPGPRSLVVRADPDDVIPEDNELDNSMAAALADARTLDVAVTAASLSSSDVEAGETVWVSVEVANRGTLDAPDVPIQLARDSGGTLVELNRGTVWLPAGQTQTTSLSWIPAVPEESVSLVVRVDPFDILRETREDNNSLPLTLRVHASALPNLTVSGADVTLDPDPPSEGESATVAAIVRNTGAVPSSPCVVRFFVGHPEEGGIAIGEVALAGVEPGGAETAALSWPRVEVRGSLGLFVVADADGEVDEYDENDNRAFRPFTALGRADLVLTAGDVQLDPAYPRAEEAVTIQATVRNLGALASVETSLQIEEGEPATSVLGVLTVPALEPGGFATLSLEWMPASPPGARPLRLLVDPDDVVEEQDEGNNTLRKVVVIQDADFYLTDPYFSPDGDGVKDDTTVAWRSTGTVRVVVSDPSGQEIRELAGAAPESGAATWDGRDDTGRLRWDGAYKLSLVGDGDRVLGSATVVLDTNRTPIHEATGPNSTAVENVTCQLPNALGGLAWAAGEDALYTIVQHGDADFPPGLVRIELGGGTAYVSQDPWYSDAYLLTEAVSPDGREALVARLGDFFAVDLLTGDRRTMGRNREGIRWSPDGRFIVAGSTVLARDGSTVTNLSGLNPRGGKWAWSPQSDRLAVGGTVVTRDGRPVFSLPLIEDQPDVSVEWTIWRGDGRIITSLHTCPDEGFAPLSVESPADPCRQWFLIHPEARTAEELPWTRWSEVAWSPDGSRFIVGAGEVRLQDGTLVGVVLPTGLSVSPHSSAAYFGEYPGSERFGTVCEGKYLDTFVLSSLANLTARLEISRLPGNAGLVLKGSASDRNLERSELDYARTDVPEAWHPIGAAFDVPIADETFAVWVPPAPGTYVVRLRVRDRAGHLRTRTRTVSWDRVPSITNFTQSTYFVSPDGNEIKDDVTFRYLVVEPTRLEVKVVGPEPDSDESPAPQEVRRAVFEYSATGPGSFTWDGRDELGQVAPDGTYTVFLNDLPFEVALDNTPPDLGYRLENVRPDGRSYFTWWPCLDIFERWPDFPTPPVQFLPLGDVFADRSWHVVDRHLESWSLHDGRFVEDSGTEPVFIVETLATGEPILDDGVPRVRLDEGRPADLVERVLASRYARRSGFVLDAQDYAGNRSEVVVAPIEEGVWPLGGQYLERESCATAFSAPVLTDHGGPEGTVYGLAPENVLLLAGSTTRPAPGQYKERFQFQPRDDHDEWTEVPTRSGQLKVHSFEEIGVDPTMTYRGRFVSAGSTGDVESDPFLFCPCQQWIRASAAGTLLVVATRLDEPVLEAWATLWSESPAGDWVPLGRFRMAAASAAADAFELEVPEISCDHRLRFAVEVLTAGGRRYPSDEIPQECQRLRADVPRGCLFKLSFWQEFPGCGGSPDDLHLEIKATSELPSRIVIDAGPEDAPRRVFEMEVPGSTSPTPFRWPQVADITGIPEGALELRGVLTPVDPRFDPVETIEWALVDRSPPVGEILVPPSDSSVCLANSASGKAVVDLIVRAEDASPRMEMTVGAHPVAGPSRLLRRECPGCDGNPPIRSGQPVETSWDASSLDSGEYVLEAGLCDRSGNKGTAATHVFVTREPPSLKAMGLSRPVISPNGDGTADDTELVVQLTQPLTLNARVRSGSAAGPVVRRLFTNRFSPATDLLVGWDGRDDGGAPVPDGAYVLVVSAADACGGTGQTTAGIEVDTQPPEVALTEPTGGQRVSATIDVLGQVTDPHLGTWTLDVSCGGSEWTRLAKTGRFVPAGTFLASWDTSRAPPGECTLRLAAEDTVGNRSAEVFATATVERGALIERVTTTPDVFSPNGDGRRETATVEYALSVRARLWLEIRDRTGHVLRVIEDGSVRDAGALVFVWDGLDDTSAPAPEGDHLVWMRAEDPDVSTVSEQKSVRLALDRTPPVLTVTHPTAGGVAPDKDSVKGSVEDPHLAEYVVTASPAGGPPVELGRGSGERRDALLAPLRPLAEGLHTIRVQASDAAENDSQLEVSFTVDSTPPRAAIQAPLAGALLLRSEAPIPVTGLVGDDHLEGWTLGFGAGTEPASFITLASGTAGGNEMTLATWDVSHVPDGEYTLLLVARDRGGLVAESRVSVTLDGQPPTVAIDTPTAGGYVTAVVPVTGTATDAHLAFWELEFAPGDATSAYRWQLLGSGVKPVATGPLGQWSPLPADGVYTQRLTVHDEVGLSASALVTTTVDTTPPATPTGLRARVTPAEEGFGFVRITWNPNTEPDLAGYGIANEIRELDNFVEDPTWGDSDVVEGRYVYEVVATDKAGNVSPPAQLEVLVDLTPPTLAFFSPAEGASVSGAVDIRGTAWSSDDFGEYRLLVGAGESPTAWTLLQRSTVPVAGGRLGEWLALVDGPYVLALEGEDTHGNSARITRPVTVDTVPPDPPVLVQVEHAPPPVDRLVPSWTPSPSSDVAGYLVYRNGRLANATTPVIGDLRGFLVQGASWDDDGLPDGEHCYTVVAMDETGNTSAPSNEICRSLDNRAPRALVVHPPDGTRFGYPLRVLAETPDLDVNRVVLERRAVGETDWTAFGETRTAPPWETTLDPAPLAPGEYDLRAVATDRTGNADIDPPSIRVVYGDATPPAAPTGLVARVDGADVALTWEPSTEPDLGSYRVYRGGRRVAEDLADPHHVDEGLEEATYGYTVTAVDDDGNESAPSGPAPAVVYALTLADPAWPVSDAPLTAVTGMGSRSDTTVGVESSGAPVASAPSAGGAFRVVGVPVALEGNLFRARGTDAVGNRSIPSNEVVVIGNVAPGAVTGLSTEVDDHEVTIGWSPVADADLFGYVLARDGIRLTEELRQTVSASVTATVDTYSSAYAFDGNPVTAWPDGPAAGEWTVVFPAPVLVTRVHLRFAPPGVPSSYSVLVGWEGRFLPIARVSANTALIADHVFLLPFATNAIRVALESPGLLAEVTVDQLDVVAAGTETAFDDEDVPDGNHSWTVTAVDRYGAEGAEATIDAPVGDTDPPEPPLDLVATPAGRDVVLTWTASPSPDVVGYVIERDGARIGESDLPGYRDVGLPNGTYVYTVRAVDAADLESDPSGPAEATIAVAPEPPSAPTILKPTDAAHPLALSVTRTDVAGRADAGSRVALEVNGEPRGSAPALPGFLERTTRYLSWSYDVALAPDGDQAAWVQYTDSLSVQDLGTSEVRFYTTGGSASHPVFSPDGSRVALTRRPGGGSPELAVLDLDDRSVSAFAAGPPADYAWSPDGTRLFVSAYESTGTSLKVVDVATGAVTEIDGSDANDIRPRWSPDGTRVALLRVWWSAIAELVVVDLSSELTELVDEQAWLQATPSWSADGRLLAWTSADRARLRVRVRDMRSGTEENGIAEAGADLVDARFSTSGEWLSFLRLARLPAGNVTRTVAARHLASGLQVEVSPPEETWETGPPDTHDWLGGQLAVRFASQLSFYPPEDGRFTLRAVSLAPGENRLVARASDPRTGLVGPDSEVVLVTVSDAVFPNLLVETAGILAAPPVPVAGDAAQIVARITNDGSADAGEVEVRVRVVDPRGVQVLETLAIVSGIEAGSSWQVRVPWTPEQPGAHSVFVTVDPDSRVEESREDDNEAEATLMVAETEGLVAEITSDRASYRVNESAIVSLAVANAGPPFSGTARTVVEDLSGREVALLEERPLALEYGRRAAWTLTWPTGTTWSGPYRFRVGVRADGEEADRDAAERAFVIQPNTSLAASVRPQPGLVPAGTPVAFALQVVNTGANAPVDGATLRLRVRAEDGGGAVVFETVRALPTLLPGTSWDASDVWPSAQPPGLYTAVLDVQSSTGATLASASAPLLVDASAALVRGTLAVDPAEVLSGEVVDAEVSVSNTGTLGLSDYPLVVEIVSGPAATVHVSAATSIDLAVGETLELVLPLDTSGVAPSSYVVRLRGGAPPASLDRTGLAVHGAIAPPSPHAPAEGASVATSHPQLVVNNASSPGGATLAYEFQLFADAALTQALPGATGVAEELSRTAWRVAANLAEDTPYWWRARATDGFSTSPWSAVASFVVDALNRPPSAPVADTPVQGARVASRQPVLVVRNALDPEGQPLLYEFRVAHRPDMAEIVVSASDVAEGLGLTEWMLPLVLEENAFYSWSARASDGVNLSPWSVPAEFRVDSVNESPSAPVPLSPVDGHDVASPTPPLVVANATDPEDDPIQYRFEVDRLPEMDSPERQASPLLPEGAGGQTSWMPLIPLLENTEYFWRAHASDGNTETPSVVASFFVNVANDAPTAPVLLDPVDGRVVGTPTPTLRLRNATDPEGDPLTYEIVVRDAAGLVVAEAADIPSGDAETEWVVGVLLDEDADFTWSARASDGELVGPWSAPAAFRVDAVAEPPTAPVPVLPADGSVVEESRPTLVVENATSPDGLPLLYTFELYAAGEPTPFARATDVPEGLETTAWTPPSDLPEGAYEWRARASDPVQDGPWSATARFEVRLDPPPAPPTGLHATPGDGSVRLGWNASPEPDVAGYRVYRSDLSGGPYALVGASATPAFDDLGLTNGVTYYYVVTALDARTESGVSAEAAARPEAPSVLVAEVRYDPGTLDALCLLSRGHGHRGKGRRDVSALRGNRRDDDDGHSHGGSRTRGHDDDGDDDDDDDDDDDHDRGDDDGGCHWPPDPPDDCPTWLYATLELPQGHDPSTIELSSLRLLGSVPADSGYDAIVDVDGDGLPERRVRFRFEDVAPLLVAGENEATIVGVAGGAEVRGAATILVVPFSVDLRISPSTINRRSKGEDILAKLEFPDGVPAEEASVSSMRLNDVVPVERVVEVDDEELKVKFDRAAVIAVLPLGKSVEIRVTGTMHGLPFVGVDHVKVKE